MKNRFFTKIIAVGITFLTLPLLSNANEVRGSIITSDNKVIAQNIDGNRVYPFKNTLTPLLGYVNANMSSKIGLEAYSQIALTRTLDVKLTINLELQQQLESMLDEKKEIYEADEIIAAVMESDTGKVLAMGSSNRYDPSHITRDDTPSLSPKFAAYIYEPGSVIKPLTLAIALDHNVVEPSTIFNTHNGRLELGNKLFITDDNKFKTLNATDIIVHSSNIGISQISWELTGKEFRDGLLNFGLGSSSSIELLRDAQGYVKPLEKLEHKIHRANSAYGYGMMTTFTQLLKAYSAFNNDGIVVTPKLIESLQDQKGNIYHTPQKKPGDTAISSKSAKQVHKILTEVVKRGTGVKAQYPGLEIGGKTSTAHIAKNGKYIREYHSSFYGFANDEFGHKYTIGVLVIRAKKKYKYFASQSAVPTFKNLVKILVEEGKLIPNAEAIKKTQEEMQDSVADENTTIESITEAITN